MIRLHFSVPVIACIASLYGAGCGGGEVTVHGPPVPRAEVIVAAPQVRGEVVVAAPQPQVVIAAPQTQIVETVPSEVVVKAPPPAERIEVMTVAPSANHVWIKGHWHWNGGEWIWNPGRWEVKRVGFRWVPAQYINRGGNVYFVAGHWGR